MVESGQQVHLPQRGRLALGAGRDKLGGILRLAYLQDHALHIGERTSGSEGGVVEAVLRIWAYLYSALASHSSKNNQVLP